MDGFGFLHDTRLFAQRTRAVQRFLGAVRNGVQGEPGSAQRTAVSRTSAAQGRGPRARGGVAGTGGCGGFDWMSGQGKHKSGGCGGGVALSRAPTHGFWFLDDRGAVFRAVPGRMSQMRSPAMFAPRTKSRCGCGGGCGGNTTGLEFLDGDSSQVPADVLANMEAGGECGCGGQRVRGIGSRCRSCERTPTPSKVERRTGVRINAWRTPSVVRVPSGATDKLRFGPGTTSGGGEGPGETEAEGESYPGVTVEPGKDAKGRPDPCISILTLHLWMDDAYALDHKCPPLWMGQPGRVDIDPRFVFGRAMNAVSGKRFACPCTKPPGKKCLVELRVRFHSRPEGDDAGGPTPVTIQFQCDCPTKEFPNGGGKYYPHPGEYYPGRPGRGPRMEICIPLLETSINIPLHEMMHGFGVDYDKYNRTTWQPMDGWKGTVMGDAHGTTITQNDICRIIKNSPGACSAGKQKCCEGYAYDPSPPVEAEVTTVPFGVQIRDRREV